MDSKIIAGLLCLILLAGCTQTPAQPPAPPDNGALVGTVISARHITGAGSDYPATITAPAGFATQVYGSINMSTAPLYVQIFPNGTSRQWYFLQSKVLPSAKQMTLSEVRSSLAVQGIASYPVNVSFFNQTTSQLFPNQTCVNMSDPTTCTTTMQNITTITPMETFTLGAYGTIRALSQNLIALDVTSFSSGTWSYNSATVNTT